MEQIVTDTSVALKWIFYQEDRAFQAAALLHGRFTGRHRLVVPSCFYYEAAHALRHSQYNLTLEQVEAALAYLRKLKLVTHPMSPSLINCALELSYAYDVPVFDAYFVATALRRKCRFVTADRKAYHRMSGLSFVELL